MKKLLLSIMALLMSAGMYAEDVTFDFDNDYQKLFPTLPGTSSNDSQDGDITETMTVTIGSISITLNPAEEGKTATRIYSSSPRLRIYSGSFTIASSGDPITYVKFNTGSNWNVTTDDKFLNGKEWSGGSAQSITFNVSKNSQIKSIEVSTGAGTVNVPVLYSIDFTKSQEGWSVSDKTLPEDLSYIWKANNYGFTASAYANDKCYAAESWLYSPVYDFSKASDVELHINHIGNKFAGEVADQVAFYASTDNGTTWNKLNVSQWPTGKDWTPVSATIDVSSCVGKSAVMFAVAYVSTETSAGTYELVDFTLKGNGSINVIISETNGPVITPGTGTYEEAQTITIEDPTGSNYTIYFTLDGSEPNEDSEIYETPFTVSETTTIKAIYVDDDDNMSDVTTAVITINKAYTTVAELIKNCTATSSTDAPTIVFKPKSVMVSGVAGSNVFFYDETGSFLIYAKNAPVKRGDNVSATFTGKLYSYNGLPELALNNEGGVEDVNIISSDNVVTPATVTAAEITAADANRYVRFEGLTYVSQETVSNKVNYTLTDGTTNIILRDNFNNLSGLMWNADCKYNLNVFVIPFRDAIQYYAVSADDVEVISTLEQPVSAWTEDKVVVRLNESVTNTFRTNSDGEVSYTSSNEAVATVANDGTISVKGTGSAVITATTAKTETYMSDTKSFALAVISNADGTAANPYTVEDVKALFVDGDTIANVWVKAYIVGFANGAYNAEKAVFGAEEALASNILIATSATETDFQNCLPVALENTPVAAKEVRSAVNLMDNADNLGKEVWLKGSIIKYFSVAGLKSVIEYSFTQPTETQVEDVNGDGNVDTQDVLTIYEFMGSYTEGDSIEGYDVNGDKLVDTQDVLKIYETMQNQ